MEDLFALAGIRKNLQIDCWEFIEKLSLSSSPKKEERQERVVMMQTEAVEKTTAASAVSGGRRTRSNATTTTTTSTTTSTVVSESTKSVIPPPPHLPSDADNLETPEQKRKKHRSKKKRTKSASNLQKEDHHISWGSVEQYCFNRSISYDTVPSDGYYPLGLGDFVEVCSTTVEELVARRQLKDYLASQGMDDPTSAHDTTPTTPKTNSKKSTSSSSSNTKSRARKDSFDLTDGDTSSSTDSSSTSSSPSKSIPRSPQVKHEKERIALLNEHVEVLPTVEKDILDELTSIRQSRDIVGCSCKPLKLDKLNVAKLKSELQSRKHLLSSEDQKSIGNIEKLKKQDLIHYLKEILKNCPTCIDQNCECKDAEISCSAAACDCVYRPGEAESCENPYGNHNFDADRVKQYREQILEQWKLAQQQAAVFAQQQ